MNLVKKLLRLFKKEEKVEEEVEKKQKKIVLSSSPGLPDVLQAQTEVVVEDEGIDINEEENNE